MVNLGQAVGYLDLDTTGFKRGFKSALGDLKILKDKSVMAADKFAAIGHSMTTVGSAMSKFVTIPLIGAGAAAVKFSSDFEKGMSEVKAITNATTEEMKKMKKAALELGSTTAFSSSEVAKGMSELGSAGFVTSEILDAMPGLLDLAASSGTDLASASEITASALRGFNLEASEAGHVADVFARAAADTNAGVVDMGEAMKFIAPVANSMGISIEETAAAIGILSNAGIKGGQAGTTLRASLSRLAKPSDEAAIAMKKMSFSAYTSEGTMKSLDQIISGLTSGMEGMTEQQKQNTIATIFGQEAMSGLMVLMEAGPDKLNSLEKSFENSDGAAKAMANTMMDNLSGSVEELLGALESLAIAFGDLLLPAIRGLTTWITKLVQKVVDMDDGTKKLIVTVMGIAAALGPILAIGGKIATGIGSMMTLISSLSTAAAAAGTTVAAVAAPIAAVIAAIVALGAAFMDLWKTNEEFRNKLTEIWNNIKATFDNFTQGIVDKLNALGFDFKDITEVLGAVWKGFTDLLSPLFIAAFEAISNTLSVVFDVLLSLFDVFSGIFTGDWEKVWNGISGIFQGIWDGIVNIFKTAWDMLTSLTDTVLGWFGTSWEKLWTDVSTFFQDIWNNIVKWFEDAWNNIINFFTKTIPAWVDSVIDWFAKIPYNIGVFVGEMMAHIANFGQSVWDWITIELPKIIQGIIDWFASLPGEIWKWLQDVVNSIANWGSEMAAKAGEAAQNVWNAIVDWFSKLPGEISKWFDEVIEFFKGLPDQMFKIGEDIINGLWNGLKAVWDSITGWFQGVIDAVQQFFGGVKDGMDEVRAETFIPGGPAVKSSNAAGLDYVPYNGYIAELHEGERVLTAEQARSQGKSKGDTYNFYSPVALTPVEAAREMKKAKQELALGFA